MRLPLDETGWSYAASTPGMSLLGGRSPRPWVNPLSEVRSLATAADFLQSGLLGNVAWSKWAIPLGSLSREVRLSADGRWLGVSPLSGSQRFLIRPLSKVPMCSQWIVID